MFKASYVDAVVRTVDDEQAHEITTAYLHHLTGGRWIRDGRVYEERVTSHRFDALVDEPNHADHPRWALLRAAQTMLAELRHLRESNAKGRHQ